VLKKTSLSLSKTQRASARNRSRVREGKSLCIASQRAPTRKMYKPSSPRKLIAKSTQNKRSEIIENTCYSKNAYEFKKKRFSRNPRFLIFRRSNLMNTMNDVNQFNIIITPKTNSHQKRNLLNLNETAFTRLKMRTLEVILKSRNRNQCTT